MMLWVQVKVPFSTLYGKKNQNIFRKTANTQAITWSLVAQANLEVNVPFWKGNKELLEIILFYSALENIFLGKLI